MSYAAEAGAAIPGIDDDEEALLDDVELKDRLPTGSKVGLVNSIRRPRCGARAGATVSAATGLRPGSRFGALVLPTL